MYYKRQNPHGGDRFHKKIKTDFSISVNPLGPPRSVRKAAAVALREADRYPDPYCRELVAALSLRHGVPEERILCGNGASELIYAYCEAAAPRRAVQVVPAFSEYRTALEMAGCAVDSYRLNAENDFLLDDKFVRYLAKSEADAVFLCTPGNPTGRLIPEAVLKMIFDLCRQRRIRLFLDECFIELCGHAESLKNRLEEYKGLFILRAFTKSFAIPGLRLGYCLCAEEALLQKMADLCPPWNISGVALAAGKKAAGETDYLKKSRAYIERERAYLAAGLAQYAKKVCPSEANYILFESEPGLDEKLARRGVAIRSAANFEGLETGWYRVAVRTHNENGKLLREIGKIAWSGTKRQPSTQTRRLR